MEKGKEIIRVGIADDHELIRVGLEFILSKESDIEIIFSISNLMDLMISLESSDIDILILDLNLEDSRGLKTLDRVSSAFPNLKILVLSSAKEDIYALNAIKNGAMGYLEKSIFSKDIIQAIREINNGRVYISKNINRLLQNSNSSLESKRVLDKFSKRELEIITMLCQGLSSKEISSKLSISQKTVSTYKRRIIDKLNLNNSGDLIKFLYENRLC